MKDNNIKRNTNKEKPKTNYQQELAGKDTPEKKHFLEKQYDR